MDTVFFLQIRRKQGEGFEHRACNAREGRSIWLCRALIGACGIDLGALVPGIEAGEKRKIAWRKRKKDWFLGKKKKNPALPAETNNAPRRIVFLVRMPSSNLEAQWASLPHPRQHKRSPVAKSYLQHK
jgi:hypothetical protein